MANDNSQPIHQVPLHIIGRILAQLDSMQQLAPAILSHRIFLDAFKDNTRTVTSSILLNQIPEKLLPFAIALQKSTKVDPRNHDAVRSVLAYLQEAILDSQGTISFLTSITPSQAAEMGRTYIATQCLCESFADEVIPVANQRLQLNHPPTISQEEMFRLGRAFLRYQLMCNLLCTTEGNPLPMEECAERFFHIFSPWVNEQLVCVYTYLEAKICAAFDELVAHDIEWGELPIYEIISERECPNIQGFLCQSLPFLSEVCRSRSYDEWAPLLQLKRIRPGLYDFQPAYTLSSMMPDETRIRDLELDNGDDPLESYGNAQFEKLRRLHDGPQDDLGSKCFRIWFLAYKETSLYYAVHHPLYTNLWECGYVLWDYPELDEDVVLPLLEQVKISERHFQRAKQPDRVTMIRSENRRSDIYWLGGTGYWPLNEIDFSRVRGLSEEKKKRLLREWDLAQSSKPKT